MSFSIFAMRLSRLSKRNLTLLSRAWMAPTICASCWSMTVGTGDVEEELVGVQIEWLKELGEALCGGGVGLK